MSCRPRSRLCTTFWEVALAALVGSPLAGCDAKVRGLVTPSASDGGLDGSTMLRASGVEYLGLPPTLNLAAAGWSTTEAFPNLEFNRPISIVEAPGTDRLFVAEQDGRLYSFERNEDASEKTLALDLSGSTQSDNDCGLLGLAFHPEFGDSESDNANYLYVHYAFSAMPIIAPEGERAEPTAPTYSRLSRFTVDRRTWTVDPSSELVLIDQYDQNLWHQGGGMYFDPADGFLYLSVGDEGNLSCAYDNCQRIDKDLFSGVLRIDVDERGGEVSHPIVRQPASGTTAGYFIPNDNPFVGQPGVLEEFYALGLRSPHRMTHDVVDDITFIGEVGEETHEEVNVLASGANFQWRKREGFDPFRSESIQDETGEPPDPLIGTWTDPLLDFTREDARTIIGGYVYRGERLPALRGKYIYGDFVYGRLWALDYDKTEDGVGVLANDLLVETPYRGTEDGITGFGVDRFGELYFGTYSTHSNLYRLVRQPERVSNAPALLSETGAFADTATLEPSSSLIPYQVNVPLWSDGAYKQRWVSLPEGSHVHFEPDGSWTFPEGTVFVKHFEMALDEREPSRRVRLETRLLVVGQGGEVYGLSYKWRPDQTDADLLFESQVEEHTMVRDDGERESFRYFYPGPSDCFECHTEGAGRVLGVRTGELNRDMIYPGAKEPRNQLLAWAANDLFDTYIPTVSSLTRLLALNDETASAEDRVRSYWDVNCSMCHGDTDISKAAWDARFSTPLDEQGVVDALPVGSAPGDQRIVAPGAPELSELYLRDQTTDPNRRMPPLGRSRTDRAYVALLKEWIEGLGPE
jgi:uncharacterized repeat protein (TIGR03806 family)